MRSKHRLPSMSSGSFLHRVGSGSPSHSSPCVSFRLPRPEIDPERPTAPLRLALITRPPANVSSPRVLTAMRPVFPFPPRPHQVARAWHARLFAAAIVGLQIHFGGGAGSVELHHPQSDPPRPLAATDVERCLNNSLVAQGKRPRCALFHQEMKTRPRFNRPGLRRISAQQPCSARKGLAKMCLLQQVVDLSAPARRLPATTPKPRRLAPLIFLNSGAQSAASHRIHANASCR